MVHRLRDNLTSDYFKAANSLNSKRARKRIVAYVEAYDDIFFWRMALSQFENEKRYFEVMLPSKQKLSHGKKSVLMSLLRGHTGENMLACVDADYDYLLQGATSQSAEVCHNPYVLHTYVYAIENYQCFAPSLHDVCVAVTLNDHALFDFEAYLSAYSVIIYPLFVWNIWLYRKGKYSAMTMSDFNKVVALGKFSIRDSEAILAKLQRNVNHKIQELRRLFPQSSTEVNQLQDDLTRLGVTPETTYLYIQGHHLFDNVVVPMLGKICDRLIQNRQSEICRTAIHQTQRVNELSCYAHSTSDITMMLRRNTGYMTSEPFQRLLKDIRDCLSLSDASKKQE